MEKNYLPLQSNFLSLPFLNIRAAVLNAAVIDIYLPFAWWRYRKRLHGYSNDRGHLYRGHLYFLNIRVMNTNVQPEQQGMKPCDKLKTVFDSRNALTNAEHIELSAETQTLIRCLARLSDIYSDVTDVMDSYWGRDQVDRITEHFCDTFHDMYFVLWGLTADIMSDTMLTETYKKM